MYVIVALLHLVGDLGNGMVTDDAGACVAARSARRVQSGVETFFEKVSTFRARVCICVQKFSMACGKLQIFPVKSGNHFCDCNLVLHRARAIPVVFYAQGGPTTLQRVPTGRWESHHWCRTAGGGGGSVRRQFAPGWTGSESVVAVKCT
jgi:hypothetical protein